MRRGHPSVFTRRTITVIVVKTNATHTSGTTILTRPYLDLVRVISTTLRLYTRVPSSVLFNLTFVQFSTFRVFFYPHGSHATRRVLSLFRVRPDFPPPTDFVNWTCHANKPSTELLPGGGPPPLRRRATRVTQRSFFFRRVTRRIDQTTFNVTRHFILRALVSRPRLFRRLVSPGESCGCTRAS